MAKDKLVDYDSTASGNTDVGGISVAEGMLPSGVNTAIREQMSHLKDFADGTEAINALAVDNLKLDGNTISSTDTNGDITIDPDGTGDTIIASGNVGIGTVSPAATLESKTSTSGAPATSGTTPANVALRLASTATTGIIDMGMNGSAPFIQATDSGDLSQEYTLVLNPNGGNVGIGTASPTKKVSTSIGLSDTDGYVLEYSGEAKAGMLVVPATGEVRMGAINSSGTYFSTFYANNSEAMRLTSTGHLGINNTNPSFPLVVSGKAANHCSAFVVATNGYAAALFYDASNTFQGQIQVGSGGTGYLTSSDYRLKTAVNYDFDATTRLKQLRPARFEWIADGDDAVPVDGFLAHEVQDVVPEAISGTKDAMMDEEYEVTPSVLDDDGNEVTPAVMGTRSVPDYQGIDQSKLVPLLVKTIQELEARITALEAS